MANPSREESDANKSAQQEEEDRKLIADKASHHDQQMGTAVVTHDDLRLLWRAVNRLHERAFGKSERDPKGETSDTPSAEFPMYDPSVGKFRRAAATAATVRESGDSYAPPPPVTQNTQRFIDRATQNQDYYDRLNAATPEPPRYAIENTPPGATNPVRDEVQPEGASVSDTDWADYQRWRSSRRSAGEV